MSAILLTTGPVATRESVKNTRRSLHYLNPSRFLEAACELENLSLGAVISNLNNVFVKKSPPEAQQVLGANPHLCSVENYTARYNKPPSKAIGLQLKAKLVKMKLVPKKIFT